MPDGKTFSSAINSHKIRGSIANPDAREIATKGAEFIEKLVSASPFVEQDFQTFAAKADISTGGFNLEQLVYCKEVQQGCSFVQCLWL